MIRYFTLCFVLFLGLYGHSQLSDFTLTVDVTDETCFGNGSLAFSVSGTQAGATMLYEVYKLPNETIPIATSTGNPIAGLTSGTYKVIAIQSLGGNTGTQTTEVTITDLTNPLTFYLQSEMICLDEGVITVNILTGTATTYQIVSGPNGFSTPPQTSNVFTDLQPGLYSVGVQDAGPCGDFLIQENLIVHTPLPPIVFTELVRVGPNLNSCDESDLSLTIIQYIEVTTAHYPLTVTFTTYPPDGSDPIVQTQVITPPPIGGFTETIPFFFDDYFFEIEVVDVCGTVYSKTVPVTLDMDLIGSHSPIHCYGMFISVLNFIHNYTIEFDIHPLGFDPELFNADHPGPFTEPEIFYGVDPTGEFIEGYYLVTATDACGRTVTGSFNIQLPSEDTEPGFSFIPDPPSFPECACTGDLNISHGYGLQSGIIIDAPDEYLDFLEDNNLSLPYDVSDFIIGSSLFVPFYGCGEYTVEVTDICGNEFLLTETASLPSFGTDDLSAEQAPGCEGFGSIQITSFLDEDTIGKIDSVYIVEAPDEFYELFNGTIGEIYDASHYTFPMPTGGGPPIWHVGINGLPAGDYEFNIQFGCEFIPFNYTIDAYQQTTIIDLDEMCGAFNLFFDHTANNNTTYFQPVKLWVTYWLEIYNETTGEWEHIPGYDDSSPFWVEPNQMNYNIYHLGNFRIVKRYPIWNNGDVFPSNITYCTEPIYEFEFIGAPKIDSVAYFPCSSGGNELFVEASGVEPLLYEITEKDNQPFYINNGENNLFTNLEEGVYNFRITDDCGNVVNGTYQVSQPFDFSIVSQLCDNEDGLLYTNYFSFLEYQWWKEDNPNEILSTSHQLFFNPFMIEEDSGTYYLNISYPENTDSCINQTLEYELTINPPNAGDDEAVVYCSYSGEYIDLFSFFTSEYDDFGVWEDLSQTGELQDNILAIGNLLQGTYEFGYSVNTCDGFDESVVTIVLTEDVPSPVIIGENSVCVGSNVQLSIENPYPYYTYVWTYPDGTTHTGESILISEIDEEKSGVYVVTAFVGSSVSEPNCTASASINVQSDYCEIPKGISPNGDGLNDNFDLSDFNVRNLKIFNRYGRMVYEAKNGYTNEWYGQSSVNNKLLPTATYYYVVTLYNGNKRTGWVYLSRAE